MKRDSRQLLPAEGVLWLRSALSRVIVQIPVLHTDSHTIRLGGEENPRRPGTISGLPVVGYNAQQRAVASSPKGNHCDCWDIIDIFGYF